jgi:putative sugar O-methyltransferase
MPSPDDILSVARARCKEAVRLRYPTQLEVGSWWGMKQERMRQRITGFKSCQEAVEHAQIGRESGFDHRIFDRRAATAVANFKVRELERGFPGWKLADSGLRESPFSLKDSLVEIDGAMYSSIFFTHLGYYLRTRALLGQTAPRRVLEIGGGYGALARIFKLADAHTSYVIVDLPECLFYAHVFLALNFPEARIGYVSLPGAAKVSDYDFLLVPAQMHATLLGEEFDLVINTGSLQEMPTAAVEFWADFTQNTIQTDLFYSFNYFLVNKKSFLESTGQNFNRICPVLDPWWEVLHFLINPEILTVDTPGRNWLEVGVKRLSPGSPDSARRRAKHLFETAGTFPVSSNWWFSAAWMAVWCDPQEKHIRELIEGIKIFRDHRNSGLPRNVFAGMKLSLRSRAKNLLKRTIFRGRTLEEDPNEFSELDFYRSLLSLNTR